MSIILHLILGCVF